MGPAHLAYPSGWKLRLGVSQVWKLYPQEVEIWCQGLGKRENHAPNRLWDELRGKTNKRLVPPVGQITWLGVRQRGVLCPQTIGNCGQGSGKRENRSPKQSEFKSRGHAIRVRQCDFFIYLRADSSFQRNYNNSIKSKMTKPDAEMPRPVFKWAQYKSKKVIKSIRQSN